MHAAWKGDEYKASRSWLLAGDVGTITGFHSDCSGYGTFVRVLEGTKLWFVIHNVDMMAIDFSDTPFDLSTLEELELNNPTRNIWVQCAVLQPGSVL
jgi:hypothetical protein